MQRAHRQRRRLVGPRGRDAPRSTRADVRRRRGHHAPDLVAEFGSERVRNTPLAEAVIAGTAAGAAAMGLRPVIDLLYAPFLTLSMDAIINSAGKLRYLSGGQFAFPMVVLGTGAGWGVGAQHNHNLEAMFVHAPGLKVVMPSNAADFRGLLKRAARRQPGDVLHGHDARPHAGRGARRRARGATRPGCGAAQRARRDAGEPTPRPWAIASRPRRNWPNSVWMRR